MNRNTPQDWWRFDTRLLNLIAFHCTGHLRQAFHLRDHLPEELNLNPMAPGSDPVSTIRNLGPRTVEDVALAGIHTAAELRALGADEGYRRLLAAGVRPHFIACYALVMGLQGRAWNDLDAVEKAHLRERFDALLSERKSAPETELRRALDALGVRL